MHKVTHKNQGSTIIEYLVALVFGLIVVWQISDVVLDLMVEHQEEYVEAMAEPTT